MFSEILSCEIYEIFTKSEILTGFNLKSEIE